MWDRKGRKGPLGFGGSVTESGIGVLEKRPGLEVKHNKISNSIGVYVSDE